MERSNQPPKTECCREQGQVSEATEASGPNDLLEAYTGKLTGRKQDSPPAKATQPRYGAYTQVGTESPFTEPKTSQSATGKGQLGLPGSKSVACEERAVRNLGDPVHARRTNCESQAGRPPQRQEVRVQREPGVRLPRSSSEQPSTEKADASQGGNRTSRSAKETGAVRKTEHHRPTYLRAIAKRDVLKSPVLENCTPGSVRGPPGNGRPYLDRHVYSERDSDLSVSPVGAAWPVRDSTMSPLWRLRRLRFWCSINISPLWGL